MGGEIVRMDLRKRDAWEVYYKFGEECSHQYEDKICGRPLGLTFDKAGNLYAIESYTGIYKIDAKSRKGELVVDASVEVRGRSDKLMNGVAVAKDGSIYYTSTSTRFGIDGGFMVMLTAPTGRVLKYDPKTRKSEVLMDDVAFANGIVLSEKEDYFLAAECSTGKVFKYHLSGKNKGKSELLMQLPGMIDNLTRNGKGGYLVGMPGIVDEFNPLADVVMRYPLFQKFLSRLVFAVSAIPETLNKYFPHPAFDEFAYWSKNIETALALAPKKFWVAEFDASGKATRTWQAHKAIGANHEIEGVSEGTAHDGWLYIAGPFNTAVARVPFKKLLN